MESETELQLLRLANGELDHAYRLAGLVLGDSRDAEDATQDALLRAWHARSSLRDQAGFQAWFERILVNVCRDRLRQRRRIRFLPLDPASVSTYARDPFAAVLDRDEMLGVLAVLDDDERLVVVLHYWSDLTLAAIAERLSWPVGTVKSRLHRALYQMEGRLRAAAPAQGGRP